MKLKLVILAGIAGVFLAGCGGPEVSPAPESGGNTQASETSENQYTGGETTAPRDYSIGAEEEFTNERIPRLGLGESADHNGMEFAVRDVALKEDLYVVTTEVTNTSSKSLDFDPDLDVGIYESDGPQAALLYESGSEFGGKFDWPLEAGQTVTYQYEIIAEKVEDLPGDTTPHAVFEYPWDGDEQIAAWELPRTDEV